MKLISPKDISSALVNVGVTRGSTIFLMTDLAKVGAIPGVETRDNFCAVYLDAIRDVIGTDGTIVMPTYTTQVARFDMEFIWEETPTILGLLPEFLRQQSGALRSLHPLSSVTALGKRQSFICSNNSTTNFGWNSPFHRMLETETRVVTIGLPSGYIMGMAHQLEAMCGVPYVYNKLLKWVPIVRGRKVNKSFSATVRHLDLAFSYDLARHVRVMRKQKNVNSAVLGESWVHSAKYTTIFESAAKKLADDPFYLLKEPPKFIENKIPFDGATAGRDGIADNNPNKANWAGFYLSDSQDPGGDESDLWD